MTNEPVNLASNMSEMFTWAKACSAICLYKNQFIPSSLNVFEMVGNLDDLVAGCRNPVSSLTFGKLIGIGVAQILGDLVTNNQCTKGENVNGNSPLAKKNFGPQHLVPVGSYSSAHLYSIPSSSAPTKAPSF